MHVYAYNNYIVCLGAGQKVEGDGPDKNWGGGGCQQVSSLSKGVGYPIFQPVVGWVMIVSDYV